MIFVTTGTYGFSELIKLIDQMVGARIICDNVYAQIGLGDYEPINFKFERYIQDLKKCFNDSCLVITHGGMTVVELIAIGKSFIAVPNRTLDGDHQFEFLQSLAAECNFVVCNDLDPEKLAKAISEAKINKINQRNFFREISKCILCDIELLCK